MNKVIIGLVTVLFFGAVFLIAYTGNGSIYFSFLKYIPGGDKTGHVVLLCLMSTVLTWLLSFRYFKIWKIRLYYGIITVFVFITFEEFLQLVSPYRNFDLIDLGCNYIGIALAGIIISVYESSIKHKAEQVAADRAPLS